MNRAICAVEFMYGGGDDKRAAARRCLDCARHDV